VPEVRPRGAGGASAARMATIANGLFPRPALRYPTIDPA
jgi:hypothetical protein